MPGVAPPLFNDAEKDVRDVSLTFLRKHVNWTEQADVALLQHYVGSQAFLDDPTRLLWGLDGYRGDLRPLAAVLFDACDRMTDATITEAFNQVESWALDLEKLSQLLLRLYGQSESSPADAAIRKGCLDKWDRILRNARYVPPTIITALDE